MNRHGHEFDKLIKAYQEARPELLQKAATMAVTFFKENFRRQGFLDKTLHPWKKRSSPISQKPIEINRGTLRRGVKKKSIKGTKAVVGFDPAIKYAEIQNDGGEIEITHKMRRFFWAMYFKAAGGVVYNRKTKDAADTPNNRKLNAQAEFWKGMALTKETHIKIPARPFIDDSATLSAEISNMFDTEILKLFTK
jgi:phage gpG-like protein